MSERVDRTRQWGPVWWLRHKGALDEATALLRQNAIASAVDFPPYDSGGALNPPLILVRLRDWPAADAVLRRHGWVRSSAWPRALVRGAYYTHSGCELALSARGGRPMAAGVQLPAVVHQARLRLWRFDADLVDFDGPLLIASGVIRPNRKWALEHARVAAEQVRPGDTVVDVGTGSGAIALVVAQRRRDARVLGIDISTRAIGCARHNAARRRLSNVRFQVGDLLAGLAPRSVQLITASLNYIAPAAFMAKDERLDWLGPPETVRELSPDGLVQTRRLIDQARHVLAPAGRLLIQSSLAQATTVRAYLAEHGFSGISAPADYLTLARLADS